MQTRASSWFWENVGLGLTQSGVSNGDPTPGGVFETAQERPPGSVGVVYFRTDINK